MNAANRHPGRPPQRAAPSSEASGPADEEDAETELDELLEDELRGVEEGVEGEGDEEDDGEGQDEEYDEGDDLPSSPRAPPLPANLKEISSLASWTVSTHKPGCGVAALRAASTAHFWQSDGPQPHLLNVHFFKQVAIRAIRLYLDFDRDESYTPTRVAFCAGTGYNDLQEFCVMQFEQPRGWIDVDFEGVGRVDDDDDDEEDSDASDDEEADSGSGLDDDDDASSEDGGASSAPEGESEEERRARRRSRRRARRRSRRRRRRLPVLRAFLVQVRILENHQNGKDTHLRGLQIYARDHKPQTAAGAERKIALRRGPLGRQPREGGGKAASFPDWGALPDLR